MLMRSAGPPGAVLLQGVGWVSERNDGDEVNPPRRGPSGAELIGLGFMVAAAVIVPMGAGLGIDLALHVSPAGLLFGLLLGIAVATTVVYREYRRYL